MLPDVYKWYFQSFCTLDIDLLRLINIVQNTNILATHGSRHHGQKGDAVDESAAENVRNR